MRILSRRRVKRRGSGGDEKDVKGNKRGQGRGKKRTWGMRGAEIGAGHMGRNLRLLHKGKDRYERELEPPVQEYLKE